MRQSAWAFVDGVLSGIARKTGWQLAEQAGLARPYRMQSVLGRSRWDADALRDLVRDEVIACLGDRNGVLVVDETGFLKKGTHSVGVARQYSGTASTLWMGAGCYLLLAPVGLILVRSRDLTVHPVATRARDT